MSVEAGCSLNCAASVVSHTGSSSSCSHIVEAQEPGLTCVLGSCLRLPVSNGVIHPCCSPMLSTGLLLPHQVAGTDAGAVSCSLSHASLPVHENWQWLSGLPVT